MNPVDLPRELVIRGIKIVDIGYIAIIYFFSAFFISTWVDERLGEFDPEKNRDKSVARLLFECVLHVYLIGVLVYVARNLVELIPFPLNGIYGFEHRKVKELGNAAVFTFIFLLFQKYLRNKLWYIRERIYGAAAAAAAATPKK